MESEAGTGSLKFNSCHGVPQPPPSGGSSGFSLGGSVCFHVECYCTETEMFKRYDKTLNWGFLIFHLELV